MTLVFKVNGIDFGPGGAGIVRGLDPQSAGVTNRIGTATATLEATGGGGYAILPAMPVQAYDLSVDQAVQSLTITNAGTGYTSPPTVTIAAPPAGGTPATAHALVSGGHVTNLIMDAFGSGYLSAPAVSLSGGGGSGATATATPSHYLTAVYFAGYVNRPVTERLEGSFEKVWDVDLQDWNLQCKRLVGLAGWPGIQVAAGSFPSQVAAVVTALQAGPPTPALLIDAVSQVADVLNGVQMPAQTFQGKNLGNMLLALCATAQALVPSVRPVFALAPDYTVGPGRWSFGGPVLYVYDSAVLPAPVQSYNDVPSLGQQTILSVTPYQRTLDGTDLVDWRESLPTALPGVAFVGFVADALATYPNDCDPIGAWRDEPIQDTTSNSGHGAAGTAVLGTGVGSVAVNAGGTGYTTPPAVSLSGGGGTGAAGVATLTQGLGTVSLGAGGSGYISPPTVAFPNGNGRGATGTLQVNAHGTITGVVITAGGTGYVQAPIINFGGTGTGAAGTALVDPNGHITGVSLQNGGSGYPAGQGVTFTGVGLGGGAAATATVSGGAVTGVTLTARGTGYTSVPDVVFTPSGGGSGATATATLTGIVASVALTETGTGYTAAPAVSFSGGGGAGAVGTASTSPCVASVTVTAGGSDYTGVAQVTFTGGGGSGATGTGTVSGGVVTGVVMTHHGSGYTSAPTVVFTGIGSINGQAQAFIDATVAITAYPRETLVIWSDVVPGMAPPLPGQTVRVSLLLEALVNVVYQVVATEHTFLQLADGTLLCRYGLTLGLPQLQLGEYPHVGGVAPVVGVPPAPPAGLGVVSTYNWSTEQADNVYSWTPSVTPSVTSYWLIETTGGAPYTHVITGHSSGSYTTHTNPGDSYSTTVEAVDSHGIHSSPIGPLTGFYASRGTPPSAPGSFAENDVYDGLTEQTIVYYTWTASTPGSGSSIDHYEIDVLTPNPGGAHYRHNAGLGLTYRDLMNPANTVLAVCRAYDNHGQVSPDSNILTFTSAAATGLRNGSFELPDLGDSTLPDGWTRTELGGMTLRRDTSTAAHGAWSLKVHNVAPGNTTSQLESNHFAGPPSGYAHIVFAAKASVAGTAATVYLGNGNGLVGGSLASLTTSWAWYDFYVQNPPPAGGQFWIHLGTLSANVDVWYDAVSLEWVDPLGPQMAQYRIGTALGGTVAQLGAGTAFPALAAAGDQFLRTDLRRAAVYDGTRWLGEEFSLGDWNYSVGASAAVGAEILTNLGEYRNTEGRGDFAYYLMYWRVRWFNSGTNNGTNFWTIALRSFTGLTTLATISTAGGSGGAWTPATVTSFTQPGVGDGIQQFITKVGSPGGLRYYSTLFARLVLT